MATLNTDLKINSGADRYVLHGLSLPRSVLNALEKRGIYCQPAVSLEHQDLANRYVLRGVESGGAVSDIGRACAFVACDGSPLPWLQRIDSIGVNGRHAIYLAESLMRLEMLRVGQTCELVVTLHTLSRLAQSKRPEIRSEMIFHGRDGSVPRDLWKPNHGALRGSVAPVFYSRAGEIVPLPVPLELAIRKITACVCCVSCKHSHVGVAPGAGSGESMTSSGPNPIVVGEPNWRPLEMVLTRGDCENFMYMGRIEEIELYKHRWTRRYLNISLDGRRFYRPAGDSYIEIARAEAIEHVFS